MRRGATACARGALALALGVGAASAVPADAAAAIAALEAKAATGHDAQVEMDLVRARMQAGEYRHALSFAAHVSGEHPDIAATAVLYAWLLRVGGQRVVADRVLAEGAARLPGDPLLRKAAQALASPLPAASGALLQPPHRLAPEECGATSIASDARVLSGAVLVAGGVFALAPAQALQGDATARLWVRNGLGQTSRAEVDRSFAADPELVVLRLASAIDADGADRQADRDPFAGSPGFAFAYAPTKPAAPAWPQLHEGFLGGATTGTGLRRLGIDVVEGTAGGPVLDASGRLAGITVRNAQGAPMLRAVSTWPALASAPGASVLVSVSASATPPRARMPTDEAYERGMRIALQLIAAP